MKKLLLICFAFFNILACQNSDSNNIPESKNTSLLPTSNGGRLDLIVVCKESLWKSEAGDALKSILLDVQYGLPQPESKFSVKQISPKDFNSLLQRSRNLIVLEESSTDSSEMIKNKWAKPQLVFSYIGSPAQIANRIKADRKKLLSNIYTLERKTVLDRIKKAPLQKVSFLKKNNLQMVLPQSFSTEVEEGNSILLWNRTLKSDQGIIINISPLNTSLNGLESSIIPLRDSLTSRFVQSEVKGSHMITESLIAPQIKPIDIDGMLAFETRGLWKTEGGDFKGGPFINYTIYDEDNNRLITLDGWVYAPELQKRNVIFELESILRSIKRTH